VVLALAVLAVQRPPIAPQPLPEDAVAAHVLAHRARVVHHAQRDHVARHAREGDIEPHVQRAQPAVVDLQPLHSLRADPERELGHEERDDAQHRAHGDRATLSSAHAVLVGGLGEEIKP